MTETKFVPHERGTLMYDMWGIDFEELRKQKAALLDTLTATKNRKTKERLMGLLHLLDDMQDAAAEVLGDEAVFGERGLE